MSLTLPSEGQSNWDEPLNAALLNLDDRVDDAAAAASSAAATATSALSRTNHTGTQSADTVTDGTTNKAFTATEKTKLAGVAAGATNNSADSYLLDRSHHTGAQATSTVTGLDTALAALDTRVDALEAAPGGGGGGASWTFQAKTASFTAAADFFYTVDATLGNVTVTPPAASEGARFAVKRIDASANTVTIDPAGSVTTDGDLTTTLIARWVTVTFISDGTNWLIESTAREAASQNGSAITSMSYAAGADGALASINSGTFVEVSSNVRLPAFTVPASGVVIIRAAATGNPNGSRISLCLWDYAGGAAYSPTTTARMAGAWSGYEDCVSGVWRVSGLTPGASVSFSLGWKNTASANSFLYSGPGYGPAIMEAWAA